MSQSSIATSHLAPLAQIACSAPIGVGGLGRHLEELVCLARSVEGLESHYFSPKPCPADIAAATATSVGETRLTELPRYTPLRFYPGSLAYAGSLAFDVAMQRLVQSEWRGFTGFSGQTLHTLRRARRLTVGPLAVVAANSHVSNVLHQHSVAVRRYPIERTWINTHLARRMLAEYHVADTIFVASEYTRETFRSAGVPEDKLVKIPLAAHHRYQRRKQRPSTDFFQVVYVGSLTVAKGVPVLLEAFTKVAGPDWRLKLVGGWSTRGMRLYLHSWLAADRRISIAPGDPLPRLVAADVAVHPSFDDGFGYGPMEALAMGIPVVVTDHTGMKEHVVEGVNGYVVPAGEVDALAERLRILSGSK